MNLKGNGNNGGGISIAVGGNQGESQIKVTGARENNLKNVSVNIPRNKLVVFTGVSGSGKSSLAFGTIFAEGQRRFMESLSSYARMFLGDMKKPDVDKIDGLSPSIAIDQKTTSKNPRSTVGTITEIYDYLRLLYARIGIAHCPKCGKEITRQSVDQIITQIFKDFTGITPDAAEGVSGMGNDGSFSSGEKDDVPFVMIECPIVKGQKGRFEKEMLDWKRQGFVRVKIDGNMWTLDEEILLDKNIKHDISLIIDRLYLRDDDEHRGRLGEDVEKALKQHIGVVTVTTNTICRNYSDRYACVECGISLSELEPRSFSFNAPFGACPKCAGIGIIERVDTNRYKGNAEALKKMYNNSKNEWFQGEVGKLMVKEVCPECGGRRLKPEILAVTVGGMNIHEFTSLSIDRALAAIDKIKVDEVSVSILKEIRARCQFLVDIGLHYLTLAREAGSLSGGESQRIRLATQIGAGLVGVLYVLDEPSIGLHQRDNEKLLRTLKKLRDMGNTLIVVEHDEDTMRSADFIVDVGPLAGVNGGEIVEAGGVDKIMANAKSITGRFLSGADSIEIPMVRRKVEKFFEVKGCKKNNLKGIDVNFPLNVLTVVTGVSGSGKSSLVNFELIESAKALIDGKGSQDTRYSGYREHNNTYIGGKDGLEGSMNERSIEMPFDKVISIDQSPIGRTPRSNPATYTGVFTSIRELFASTKDAQERGYGNGRFSFNVKGGRCESCEGDGMKKIEMHFLPDIYVKCDVCKGARYNRETLQVKYKGKSIANILDMTVDEAVVFFEKLPAIWRKIKTLQDVGLGYVKLGQPSTALSGGEAQRVKLATELSKVSTGKTLYVLDEPTTGLSTFDVKKLIDILNRLVNAGNTLVVIEHNLDVIKVADHIIDLGPEGGSGGGEVIAVGTPEEVAQNEKSWTGKYIKKSLKKVID
ncbi:MAG: excinuclease ABC subunit UvrA [Christensenellaceae bacterium]|jgi:excinuclease ABC subunit A|nr:excinuclease ABC subunit UvrA [Christensenellaceae bacterium]